MISCPLTIRLLKWMVPLVEHTERTDHGHILWHKLKNKKLKVENLRSDSQVFQSADPYAQPTVEGWVPSLLMDAKAFHVDNNMGTTSTLPQYGPSGKATTSIPERGCGSMQRTQ